MVNILGLEITDPVAYIKDKAIQLLNYLGYEWPVTDDGVLDSWGDRWAAIESRINTFVQDLDDGVAHVLANNEGEAVTAFSTYMSGESNLSSLRSIATAAPLAAGAYHGAALLIRALRTYVIGKLILDAVRIVAAIVSGGLAAGASILIGMGVGALINIAIDQAINQLLGAA